jgi:hypothetical protein
MEAQMALVSGMAEQDEGYTRILENTHSARLLSKAKNGKALVGDKLNVAIMQNPPRLRRGQHTGAATGNAPLGAHVTDFPSLDLDNLYSEPHTGKCFVDNNIVFKAVGVVHGWYLPKGSEDKYKNQMLAIRLGTVQNIRSAIASSTTINAMLHGAPVYGVKRCVGSPRLSSESSNMERLKEFYGFDDGFSGGPSYDIETEFFGDTGEWSPMEFKCIEFYDWDISAPRPKSTPPATPAKRTRKSKK